MSPAMAATCRATLAASRSARRGANRPGQNQGRAGAATVAQALRKPTARGLACAVASGLLFSVSTVSAQKAIDSGLPVALVAAARPVGRVRCYGCWPRSPRMRWCRGRPDCA